MSDFRCISDIIDEALGQGIVGDDRQIRIGRLRGVVFASDGNGVFCVARSFYFAPILDRSVVRKRVCDFPSLGFYDETIFIDGKSLGLCDECVFSDQTYALRDFDDCGFVKVFECIGVDDFDIGRQRNDRAIITIIGTFYVNQCRKNDFETGMIVYCILIDPGIAQKQLYVVAEEFARIRNFNQRRTAAERIFADGAELLSRREFFQLVTREEYVLTDFSNVIGESDLGELETGFEHPVLDFSKGCGESYGPESGIHKCAVLKHFYRTR